MICAPAGLKPLPTLGITTYNADTSLPLMKTKGLSDHPVVAMLSHCLHTALFAGRQWPLETSDTFKGLWGHHIPDLP